MEHEAEMHRLEDKIKEADKKVEGLTKKLEEVRCRGQASTESDEYVPLLILLIMQRALEWRTIESYA